MPAVTICEKTRTKATVAVLMQLDHHLDSEANWEHPWKQIKEYLAAYEELMGWLPPEKRWDVASGSLGILVR